MRYFDYEPSALVIKLLNQNTQDLKKNLGKIKEQKTKLDNDKRNSTNYKNENDRFNMILVLIDRIYQFFEYKYLSKVEKQSGRQQRNQNPILLVTSIDDYTELKNNANKYYETNFSYSANNEQFSLNNLKKFFISANNQQATKERTKGFLRNTILKEKKNKIVSANPRSQKEEKEIMLGIYNNIVKLFASLFETVNKEQDEQSDITDMSELESEESAKQKKPKEDKE